MPNAGAQAFGQMALAHPLVHGIHARSVARNPLGLLIQILRQHGIYKNGKTLIMAASNADRYLKMQTLSPASGVLRA
jgi:hypothetical protein